MQLSELEIKVRVTKNLYKNFDSYERRQRWILKQLLELYSKETRPNGLAKTIEV